MMSFHVKFLSGWFSAAAMVPGFCVPVSSGHIEEKSVPVHIEGSLISARSETNANSPVRERQKLFMRSENKDGLVNDEPEPKPLSPALKTKVELEAFLQELETLLGKRIDKSLKGALTGTDPNRAAAVESVMTQGLVLDEDRPPDTLLGATLADFVSKVRASLYGEDGETIFGDDISAAGRLHRLDLVKDFVKELVGSIGMKPIDPNTPVTKAIDKLYYDLAEGGVDEGKGPEDEQLSKTLQEFLLKVREFVDDGDVLGAEDPTADDPIR